MMNPISAMRSASIFGKPSSQPKRFLSNIAPVRFGAPPEAPGMTPSRITPPQFGPMEIPEPEQEGSDAGDYFDQITRLRQNKGPALTAYQNALKTMPTMAEHEPSKMRRFGAILTGALAGFGGGAGAGMAAATHFNETPYRRAMEEYGSKLSGLGESAQLEMDEMEQQIRALKEARALGLQYDEYRLKQLELEYERQFNQGKLRVDERNADTNAFVAETGRRTSDNTGTYQTGLLGIGRSNANTNARRAGDQARDIDSRISDRTARQGIEKSRIAASLQKNRQDITPAEQQRAIDNALRVMSTDPRFQAFITNDEGIYDINSGAANSSPMYAEFLRELKRKAELSMSSGTPFDSEFGGPDEDGDFIIELEP